MQGKCASQSCQQLTAAPSRVNWGCGTFGNMVRPMDKSMDEELRTLVYLVHEYISYCT